MSDFNHTDRPNIVTLYFFQLNLVNIEKKIKCGVKKEINATENGWKIERLREKRRKKTETDDIELIFKILILR